MANVRPHPQRAPARRVFACVQTATVWLVVATALPACARVGGSRVPAPQPTATGSEPTASADRDRTTSTARTPRRRPALVGESPDSASRTAEARETAWDVDDTEDGEQSGRSGVAEADYVDDAYIAWLDGPDEIRESAFGDRDEIQERVEFWMEFWQGRGRGYFERYLSRMSLYQPVVDQALMEQGLPPVLRYLPLIESGYSPVAVSRVGATGLWQFMSPTARWLGMRVDGFVDERRDPLRSTEEALGYLTTLRRDFDSWYLALAAYNAGPGRIRGILRRNAPNAPRGDSLFWAISEKFPRETTYYVPKLLAAAELSRNAEQYGFETPDPANAQTFQSVEVEGTTSLDVVAKAANVPVEHIVALNPHLVQGMTPLNTMWAVRVPPSAVDGFAERLALVPPDERVTFVQHRVASGETLGHIAQSYGIRLSQLRAANPGVRPQRMQIGQRLIIPRGPRSTSDRVATRVATQETTTTDRATTERASTQQASTETEPADALRAASDGSTRDDEDIASASTHVVRSGESLWVISRRYGVALNDLLAWNELDRGSVLMPGAELEIRGSAGVATRVATRTREYRVRSGDTLSQIAEQHGVSTRDLLQQNGLSSRSVIKPGQRLRIPAAG